MNNYKIIHQGDSKRLDLVLKDSLTDYSRNYLTSLVSNNLVSVGGKIINKNSFLVTKQAVVEIAIPPVSKNLTIGNSVEIPILKETEDFLIINKPSGLLAHPAKTDPSRPSVASIIKDKLERYYQNSSDRPGIVHRLDKDTTGIMVIAKHPIAFNRISAAFMQRKVTKKYLCVVARPPAWNEIKIQKPIGRNPRDPRKMQVYGIAAKEALTFAKVLAKDKEHALLEVEIFTGRTHQIRVHLAYLGFPVLGDEVYGQASDKISRQALHAWKLRFLYKNTAVNSISPIPSDIEQIIQEKNWGNLIKSE